MRGLWSGLVAACLTLAAGAPSLAQKAGAIFDKPVSTRMFGKDDAPKVICTVYADGAVREVQDGPSAEKAMLLKGPNAACEAKAPTGAITLETEGLYLLGRIGDHLVFSALDPHGAVDFSVVDARSGKTVLTGGTHGTPEFKSARSAGSVTTLVYRRGINAPCSLANSGARCWGSLVDDGKIPNSLARPAPNPSICAASYRKEKSPKDNPSIVSFDAETTIDAAGKVTTLAKGKVACDPMP